MSSAILTAAVAGFFLGASLIIAIGAQNAFILRQGLLGRHVFVLCLICALSDAVLAFRRALRPQTLMAAAASEGGLRTAVAACLAFTFLNPHVYLDTVLLV